jgi:hypothetical protein
VSPSKKPSSVVLLWGEDGFRLREEALVVLGDLRATQVELAQWQGVEAPSIRRVFGMQLRIEAQPPYPPAEVERHRQLTWQLRWDPGRKSPSLTVAARV